MMAAATIPGTVWAQYEVMDAETTAKVKKAAVMVFTARSAQEKGDTPLGSGSGYFINSTGLMITNNHVVDPTHGAPDWYKHQYYYQYGIHTWWIITDSGTDDEKTWEAVVVYQNEAADQAILQVFDDDKEPLQTPSFLRFLPESRLTKRAKVYALGFPGGDRQRTVRDKHPEVTITVGHVLEFPRTAGGRIRRIYTDVIARPGNSGGAMVDVDGFLVGTVTLMTKPEGREDTGGANFSALVPAALTADFIRSAYALDKIPGSTDFKPFMAMLTNEDGRINIPQYGRLKERDVVFFPDGNRFHGNIQTDKIIWESDLGTLEVPNEAIAYVLTDAMGSEIFLEGGNRILASQDPSHFEFAPLGGTRSEHEFLDVAAVGFKTSDRELNKVKGEAVILDADIAYLVMSDVKGEAAFETRAGTLKLKLQDMQRIETRDDGQQTVIMADGRVMSGNFTDDKLEGIIAATNTPIRFSLEHVQKAIIENSFYGLENVAGINLIQVMHTADKDVRKIANIIESDDRSAAERYLKPLLEPDAFRRLPDVKKEQVRLLDAVWQLRNGKYEEAKKAFALNSRAQDGNVQAYAKASMEVLRRCEPNKYTYNGKPISDMATFAAAGLELANEIIQKVRDLLKDEQTMTGRRGEFARALVEVKRYTPQLELAGVLGGGDADDELMRLWKYCTRSVIREFQRLDKEVEEMEKEQQNRSATPIRGGRQVSANAGMERRMREIAQERQRLEEIYWEYFEKLWEYGFRIEDPDLQKEKDDQSFEDEPEEDKPKPDDGP